jgi:hypothetical protein
MRREACDFSPLETDRSRGRAQSAGDQIEGRALARAVRANEAENLAFAHFERDLVHRQESSEAFAKPFDGEHQARAA